MEVRILMEGEIAQAVNLAKMVYDVSVRNFLTNKMWAKYFDDYMVGDNILRQVKQGELTMWGAIHQGEILAVSAMTKSGHITMLYVHPGISRRGYGTVLVKTMKKYAAEICELKSVTINVMPAWISTYFSKRGFIAVQPNQNINSPYITMQSKIKSEVRYKTKKIPTKLVLGMTIGCLLFLFAGTIGITIYLL